jgi:hypothetical protein
MSARLLLRIRGGATLASAVAIACVNAPDPSGASLYTDAGSSLGARDAGVISDDAGHVLKALPFPADPGAGGVYVTLSGESNALTGYAFPPTDWGGGTFMVDGWQFAIERFLVVVDHVTLWSNPNLDPTNASKHGSAVAQLDGPFVVDLHKSGSPPTYVTGLGGAPEEATPIGVITRQDKNGGGALDPEETYAFGFSTVPAAYVAPAGEPGPFNVNLDTSATADFDLMVQNGYSALYVGTASWVGDRSPYGCTQTQTSSAGRDAGYDFAQLPTRLSFRIGFATPTSYVNCQNAALAGRPVGNEDHPRGIQVSPSQSAIAQVTLHMDHPFWESFAENSPIHFDPIAAQYAGLGLDGGAPTATMEAMIGVPFTAFTDRTGAPLPWRSCAGTYYQPPTSGQMAYKTVSVPINPSGTCVAGNCPAIRDFYDYLRYSQSSQGHLNSQGACYVERQYPAPAAN